MAKKIEQSWEPGTLDKTRKNLGTLSEEEAKKMMDVLGGEILQEKSAPIDYKALPKNMIFAKKGSGRSANSASMEATNQMASIKEPEKKFTLPNIDSKEKQQFDKLMMSDDYKIKPSYGLFNFVLRFKKSNDKLKKAFVEYTLPKDIEHLNEFIMSVKSIVQIAPESYKENILQSEEEKYLFLKTVGSWNTKEIKYFLNSLTAHPENVNIVDTADFIKSVYRLLIKIYYLGEKRIADMFKDIFNDLAKYPRMDKKKLSTFVKTAIREWFYVYSKVIKGLYPILMRQCSKHCDNFQDFFLTKTSNILTFLDMTKYDLLLPNKRGKNAESAEQNDKTQKAEIEKAKKEEKPSHDSNYVSSGFKLLEQLFPEAGFSKLEEHPDMYPYFQPLYQFRDGFQLLSTENPLLVTITLLRITEDLLQGCRNIEFTGELDEGEDADKLQTIIGEWALYREVLFERNYCSIIKEFVNSEYSNPGDFKKSQYGLKLLTDMLWQTKYYFLPYFNFQQLILEKPKNDNPYKQLFLRTTHLKKMLSKIVKSIAVAEKNNGDVIGVANPWVKYHFGVQTPISKRLNVILGAKKTADETRATNANLLKYTLCIVSVLDWWINEKTSPAYSYDGTDLYRISKADGAPEFSVPVRSDQNDLFMAGLKNSIAAKKAAD